MVKMQVAGDERRRAWAGPVSRQPFVRRLVEMLPNRFAGAGIETDDRLSVTRLSHRVETAVLEENRRVAFTQRTAPQLLRPGLGPAHGEAFGRGAPVPGGAAPLRPRRACLVSGQRRDDRARSQKDE